MEFFKKVVKNTFLTFGEYFLTMEGECRPASRLSGKKGRGGEGTNTAASATTSPATKAPFTDLFQIKSIS